ncbi:MAG: hypothetical protein LBJ39_02950 [Tannerellaceae bacterium]|jgi:hypothetical protein|nr:hypothetical protein [Tannerellaceae bacterium]
MERYAQKIISVLQRHNIPGVFNAENSLVYAYRETGNGDIYGIYECRGTRIVCYAVCSLPVPGEKQEQVMEYLSGISKGKSGEGFYLDHITGCIAFGAGYCTHKGGTGRQAATFEEFCMKPFDMFLKYQQSIYEIILK